MPGDMISCIRRPHKNHFVFAVMIKADSLQAMAWQQHTTVLLFTQGILFLGLYEADASKCTTEMLLYITSFISRGIFIWEMECMYKPGSLIRRNLRLTRTWCMEIWLTKQSKV